MPDHATGSRALVRRIASTFWLSFASLGVIAGVYWGAVSVGWTDGFWVMLWLAVGATVLIVGVPHAVAAWRRVRDYPEVLAELTACRAQVEWFERNGEEDEARTAAAYKAGFEAGERSGEGAFRALFADPPEIVGVAMFRGQLALMGRTTDQAGSYGARFTVKSRDTSDVMGVVELGSPLPERGVSYLVCVEATASGFWEGVARRVEEGLGPPDGVVLERHWPFSSFTRALSRWVVDARNGQLGEVPRV